TRFKCDWSSDVCSSDLPSPNPLPKGEGVYLQRLGTLSGKPRVTPCSQAALVYSPLNAREKHSHGRFDSDELRPRACSQSEESHRSEERRVGKECSIRCQ